MAERNTRACPHCGGRLAAAPATGICPACGRPLYPPAEEVRDRIRRSDVLRRRADERLGLLGREVGDPDGHLARVAASLQAGHELTEAAAALEGRMGALEHQSVALRTKLAEAERGLVDAAEIVKRLGGLDASIQQLGARYLLAREEASRLLEEKLALRAELAGLADRLDRQASPHPHRSTAEVTEARRQIRDALRRITTTPPLPG